MSLKNAKLNWVEEVESEEANGRKSKKPRIKTESTDSSRENSDNNRKRMKPNKKTEWKTKLVHDKPSKDPVWETNKIHDDSVKKSIELETDSTILLRRQKQIDYGKNTVGYHNYVKAVPIEQRKKEDPMTPNKYVKYSRRSWDQLIKLWRKKLHEYDPDSKESDDCGE